MSNKRYLKKRILQVCGDIATEAILAAVIFAKEVDRDKINEVINDVAALQEATLVKSNFSFDKSPRDFEDKGAYRKARRKYFAEAYNRLNKDFVDQAVEIVKKLNEIVPENVRKTISAM